MIIMSSMFFLEKMDCLSIFSQIAAAIYRYMPHLTGIRKKLQLQSRASAKWKVEYSTKILSFPRSVINKQEFLIEQQV